MVAGDEKVDNTVVVVAVGNSNPDGYSLVLVGHFRCCYSSLEICVNILWLFEMDWRAAVFDDTAAAAAVPQEVDVNMGLR